MIVHVPSLGSAATQSGSAAAQLVLDAGDELRLGTADRKPMRLEPLLEVGDWEGVELAALRLALRQVDRQDAVVRRRD